MGIVAHFCVLHATMTPMIPQQFRAGSALLGAALIYASFGLLIRILSDMYGDFAQVTARFLLAAAILFIIRAIAKKSLNLSKKQFIFASIIGVTFSALIMLFTLGVVTEKIATVIFVFYAASIISSLFFGSMFFKEKNKSAIAVTLALLGFFAFSGISLAVSFGIIAGVLSGVLDGLTNSLRKYLKDADTQSVMQVQFISGTLFAGIVMLFMSEPIIKEVTLLPILVTIIFAVLQIKLNELLYYGFQRMDVNVATIILSSEVVFASLIGYFFFAEVLSLTEMVGGFLILVASIVNAWSFKQSS